MFKFLRARHRKLYWQLGKRYHVWPERVYKLAHGKRAKNGLETKIVHELLSEGVIHRHSSSSPTDEDKVIFAK